MTMPTLPMPGDHFTTNEPYEPHRWIVIASTWIDDMADAPTALLLLLDREPPYYTVADISWHLRTGWRFDHRETHPNINPAVTDGYAQRGGDY